MSEPISEMTGSRLLPPKNFRAVRLRNCCYTCRHKVQVFDAAVCERDRTLELGPEAVLQVCDYYAANRDITREGGP